MMVALFEAQEQTASPATQVQHARSRRDQLDDALVIDAPPVENARWAGSVFRSAACRGKGRRRCRAVVKKGADEFAVAGDLIRQQKGIVTAIALDVAVVYGRIVGDEGVDDVAGLVGWKQPIAGETDHQ